MKIFLATAMLLVMAPRNAEAQFYPDSLANWCLRNNVSPAGFFLVMHMLDDPDTLINGMTYKRIDEILFENSWPTCFPRYYVRSAPDGKGYMFVPELEMEYLTGDLNANVMDTLYNVLISDETGSCSNVIYTYINCQLTLTDVVVTAIDTIANAGVTIVRHHVWPLCADALEPRFWQAGIGTEHGPLLVLTPGLAHLDLRHASVGDTCYYNSSTLPQGLPGGPACCVVIENSIDEHVGEGSPIRVYPNPSGGSFTMEFSDPLLAESYYSVYDALGRLLYQRPLPRGATLEEVDLTRFGPGAYVLRVADPEGQRYERVVVE